MEVEDRLDRPKSEAAALIFLDHFLTAVIKCNALLGYFLSLELIV